MSDEILVHISKSASRHNDELYQRLARSYHDFEPYQVYKIEQRQNSDGTNHCNASQPGTPSLEEEDTQQQTPKATNACTSYDSYGSFPSDISPEDQLNRSEILDSQSCASQNTSSIPASSRLAELEQIHVLWKERKRFRESPLHAQSSVNLTFQNPGHAGTTFIDDTQLAIQTLQSQLQTQSPMTSELTTQKASNSQVTLDSEILSSPLLSDGLQTHGITGQTTFKTVYLSPPKKFNGIERISGMTRNVNPPKHSESVVIDHVAKNQSDSNVPQGLDFTNLLSEVFPPPPEISVNQPENLPSQSTTFLETVQKQNSTRFKRSKSTRNLTNDDRGCWVINCAKWPGTAQYEFWTTLQDHVLSGRLGWGTALYRESSSGEDLGRVKLFCWAEVVEHTWLVLWLCSKGRVMESRLVWYDAGGEALIEVS